MKLFLSLIVIATVCACGQSSDNSSQSSKPLFSKWSNSNLSVDLTAAQFNSQMSMTFTFANGGQCTMNAVIAGSDSSGTVNTSGAYWSGGNVDPGCSFNESFTYSNANSNLSVCDSITCFKFN